MRASCGMVGVMRVMLIARHAAQPSCVMLFMFSECSHVEYMRHAAMLRLWSDE